MSAAAAEDQETILSEVLAASLGGAVSAGILYPLEVLKTKMQASSGSSSNSSNNDDDDDDGDADDEYDGVTKKLAARKGKQQQSKLQQQQHPPSSMIPYMRYLYETEGMGVFFRGVETSSFQSALEKALYFFAYTGLKEGWEEFIGPLGNGSTLFLGCVAEWCHLPITLPVDAWTTRIQTQESTNNNKHLTPMAILITMLNDPNVRFYKGLQAYWLLCLKPALQYTVYERVKVLVLAHRLSLVQQHQQQQGNNNNTTNTKSLSAAESFLLGMIARTVATVLVFPFLRAKVLLQASQNNKQPTSTTSDNKSNTTTTTTTTTTSTSTINNSIPELLWNLLQRDGFCKGWYQGLGPELTRGVLSAALMLMIKEKVAALVRKALLPTLPPTVSPKTTTLQSPYSSRS